MEISAALAAARDHHQSVLTTLRRNGRDAYRAAMVAERRVVVRLLPDHAHGALR